MGAVAALGVGCAACSSVNPFSIGKAYADTISARTARISMTAEVTVPGASGAQQSVHLAANGAMNLATKAADVTATMPVIGSLEMRIVGTTMYMHFPAALANQIPGGKSWVSLSFGQLCGGSGGSLFGGAGAADPGSALEQLRNSGSVVRDVGSGTVDGAPATHYRVTIDMAKALQSAKTRCPGGPVGQNLQNVAGRIHFQPMDVWVDGQDRVRRVHFVETVPVQSKSITTDMTMDLSDFGTPVQVSAPPAADTLDAAQIPGFDQAAQGAT